MKVKNRLKIKLSLALLLFCNVFAMGQGSIELVGVDCEFYGIHSYEDRNLKTFGRPNVDSCRMELPALTKNTFMLVGCNKDVFPLWVQPGDQLSLNVETGVLEGGNAKINSYLKEWKERYLVKNTLFYNRLLSAGVTQRQVDYDLDQIAGANYPQELRSAVEQQLKELKAAKIGDPDFVEYFATLIDDSYWMALIGSNYVLEFKGREPSAEVLKAILEVKLDEDILQSGSKYEIVKGYVNAHEKLGHIEVGLENFVAQRASVIENAAVKEYYVLSQLKGLSDLGEAPYCNELFESALPLVISEEGKAQYQKYYKAMAPDKFKGKPAVNLTAVKTDDQAFSMEELKGKYVYVDVWATWCGPCKQMSPFFMELADQYKGKDIVFLSLSADNKSAGAAWKNYVAEHFNASVLAVWTGNGFRNAFVQHYGMNTIPRFMLIDPEGNVVSSKFWRPNDPRLPLYFDQLLKSKLANN